MDIRSLRPAKDFAIQYGVKCVVYGPAGKGKTPILNTAPRPVLLACEPGLLSMKHSMIPTWCAPTAKELDEFFKWAFHSNEMKNFDTIGIDSSSEMCETYLKRAEIQNKHGLAAYGQMARDSLEQLDGLYYMQHKHIYLIAKQEIVQSVNIPTKRPYYPGRELPIKVPHKYDAILHLDTYNIPQVGQEVAFRCIGSLDTLARNRSGNLNEFEPPHFGNLVTKAMSA